MKSSSALVAATRQTPALTPRLQLAVRLLQLSSLEYAQELNATLARNPFLETEDEAEARHVHDDAANDSLRGEPSGLDAQGGAAPEPASPLASERAASLDDAAPDPALHDTADLDERADLDVWAAPGPSERGDGAGELGAVDLAAAHIGLREHLLFQANVLRLSDRDRSLLHVLIGSLDDDGYLRTAPSDAARLAGLAPPPDAREIGTALKLLQSFEPAGVGAANLRECLLLQWQQRSGDDEAEHALGLRILTDHLEALGRHDTLDLARRCAEEPARVDRVCQAIRRLDPRPGQAYAPDESRYITPDVLVSKTRGRWTARLNSAVVPRLRLNQRYAQLFQGHRDARHHELAGHLQEARWTLRNIEQRFSTILDVSNAILQRQHRFLDLGEFAMKPLMLREIAADCGIHESTVCRVTNNKYMATPGGVYELTYFFSRAMAMRSGGACSPTAIRGLIRDLIAAEPPGAPLSDVEITRQLTRQGLQVARRTVTKYRQMLKLPPVERRRLYLPDA